jgi:type IV secretion system protein VirD4
MADDDAGVLEAAAVAIAGIGGGWFIGSWAASVLFDQGWLRANVGDAFDAAKCLPDHWGDPRLAWAQPFRDRLPGPVAYYTAIVVTLVTGIAVLQLCRGLWRTMGSAGQRKRRRLGQVVRGRFAKRRELATLMVPAGRVPPGRFLIGQAGRPWWKRKLDPRGPVWLATEWRAGTPMPPRWRVWRRWWFRRNQYNRGAVMIMGASQSGKSVTTVGAAAMWHGPIIASSVKGDQVATIAALRAHGLGDDSGVKVFDPVDSVSPVLKSRFGVGSWSPLTRGMDFDRAMKAAKSLADSLGEPGGGNEAFFRTSAQALVGGLLWLAAQLDEVRYRQGRHGGGMATVRTWIDGAVPWVSHDETAAPGNDLVGLLQSVRSAEWVKPGDYDKAYQAIESRLGPAMPAETRGGIVGTAQNMVWPWLNSSVEASSADADITLGWVLGDDQTDEERRTEPRSLFLASPPSDMRRFAPVFAGCLNDLLEQASMRYNERGVPFDPPLLILVDEAGNTPIGELPEFASTVAAMGILLVCVYQSVAQITSQYKDKTGTLIANFLTKIMFAGQSDPDTLELFAKLLGEEEVRQTSVTDSEGHDSAQTSTMLTGLTPLAQLRTMRVGDFLCLHGTLPPIWGRWLPWFKLRAFATQRRIIEAFNNEIDTEDAEIKARLAHVKEVAQDQGIV